jgi:hypothetical protein
MRACRVRGDQAPFLDGSTASGSISAIARTPTTALVSKKFIFIMIKLCLVMGDEKHFVFVTSI